jgi:hypothetical protein
LYITNEQPCCCSSIGRYICIAKIYGLFCRDVRRDCQHLAFCNSAWRLLQSFVCLSVCLVLSRLMSSFVECVDGEEIMKNLRYERHFAAACSCPLNENVFLVFTERFPFCTEFPFVCTFVQLIEPKGSLPHSQVPFTCP